MDPSFCSVLGNCTSVMNFRVGIHLRLGKCLCVVSLLVTVFVFKDIFPSEETREDLWSVVTKKKKEEEEEEEEEKKKNLVC